MVHFTPGPHHIKKVHKKVHNETIVVPHVNAEHVAGKSTSSINHGTLGLGVIAMSTTLMLAFGFPLNTIPQLISFSVLLPLAVGCTLHGLSAGSDAKVNFGKLFIGSGIAACVVFMFALILHALRLIDIKDLRGELASILVAAGYDLWREISSSLNIG